MQPLGRAACNPNITSIIRTTITKISFETNSFLIPWINVRYFDIWTDFIYFVNDANLFWVVVIEKKIANNQFLLGLSVPWLWLYASSGIFGSDKVIWISCNPGSSRTGSIGVWPYLLVFRERLIHCRLATAELVISVAGSKGGGVRGVRTPPEIPRKKFPAHGKIAFICWRIVSKFVWLDLSHKDDQNRGENTNISKIFLGENPPKQPITIQWIS